MSIASINNDPASVGSTGATQSSSNVRSSVREARRDFDELYTALKNGNLAAAQGAYGSFQQVQAGLAGASSPTTTAGATSGATAVQTDWAALGQALQAGSLADSRDALGKLEQDAQSAWQSQLQQSTQNAQTVYELMQGALANGSTATAGTTQTSHAQPNDLLNYLGALGQNLVGSDSSSTQDLLNQLVQQLMDAEHLLADGNGGHHHHHHHHAELNAANDAAVGAATTSATTVSGATTTGTAAVAASA